MPEQGPLDVLTHALQQFGALFPANPVRHGLMLGFDPAGNKILKSETQPVTQALLLAHLTGTCRLGYLPMTEAGTSVGMIDVDKKNVPDVSASLKALKNACAELGLHAHPEWSTRGGVHLWVFFDAPLPPRTVRSALRRVVRLAQLPDGTEVFPKGDEVTSNWILMPYSGALADPQGLGKWFLTEADSATPVPVWNLVAQLQINPVQIAEALAAIQQAKPSGEAVAPATSASAPATTTSDAAALPAAVIVQLIGKVGHIRPSARHDTAGALLNVAQRGGKLAEMAEVLQTQDVYDRWFPDGDRDHATWCAEIERWVSNVSARDGTGRGLLYLHEQGFAVAMAELPLAQDDPPPYAIVGGHTIYMRPGRKGPEPVRLANFSARIVAEIIGDDGVAQTREYEIAGRLASGGQLDTIRVAAAEFGALAWIPDRWGARAIMMPGKVHKDHLAAAVQCLSQTQMQEKHIYKQLGWRKIGNAWVYLSGSGGMGATGLDNTIEVELPKSLQKYVLPAPGARSRTPDQPLLDVRSPQQREVEASLGLLDLAPDVVTVPLWLSMWRAVLIRADFTVWLEGKTGAGKSTLVALMLSHFGAEQTAQGLPGFSSTDNFLEELMFTAADSPLVIDDCAPDTGQGRRGAQPGARLLRAQGNGVGRGRMEGNGDLRPPHHPRCLLLMTAEGEPSGHSAQARTLIVSMTPGSMVWEKLLGAQQNAERGLLAQALSDYVSWLAPRLDTVRASQGEAITRYRPEFRSVHARTSTSCAELMWGLEHLLQYFRDSNLLTANECAVLNDRCLTALRVLAQRQGVRQGDADPVKRFIEGIRSLVASGQVNIGAISGGAGHSPGQPCIGYFSDDEVLLLPQLAVKEVRNLLLDDGLVVTQDTLLQRLAEEGWLTVDGTHRCPKRSLPTGGRVRVMVFQREALFPTEE
jgi:hypothetical protein